ncbi:hypothetical protein EVAR_45494_1 [Eumeta japonica]|uniref:Uncharacterized protein n=1 Tax=Eumeta variegata TaxID=151549 RepID=A0A4C1WDS6_EUMVA|nr:hypothetical protein EVAR_45494_1 [Eumeta japonica]
MPQPVTHSIVPRPHIRFRPQFRSPSRSRSGLHSVPIRLYSRPVSNSLPHPAFNPYFATSHNSDLDEAGNHSRAVARGQNEHGIGARGVDRFSSLGGPISLLTRGEVSEPSTVCLVCFMFDASKALYVSVGMRGAFFLRNAQINGRGPALGD